MGSQIYHDSDPLNPSACVLDMSTYAAGYLNDNTIQITDI